MHDLCLMCATCVNLIWEWWIICTYTCIYQIVLSMFWPPSWKCYGRQWVRSASGSAYDRLFLNCSRGILTSHVDRFAQLCAKSPRMVAYFSKATPFVSAIKTKVNTWITVWKHRIHAQKAFPEVLSCMRTQNQYDYLKRFAFMITWAWTRELSISTWLVCK